MTVNIEKMNYPWLAKHLSPEAILKLEIIMIPNRNICLKRVNYLTMSSGFKWGLEDDYAEVLLLDADGEKLGRVGEIYHPPKPITWWRRNPKPYMIFNPNETVAEAIKRLGIRGKVRYVLDVTLRKLYL